MEIVNIKIDKLKPAEYNPRLDLQPEDKEYQDIKRSMLEFGLVEPLVVNKDYTVIAGHQRLKILRERNWSLIPCIIVDLDKQKEKMLNIALNKISGDWDRAKLKDMLEELDTGEFDITLTGFGEQEIEDLMTEFHIEPEEDDFDIDKAVEEIKEPICKKGDIWQLGEHRLMCGDATVKDDVKRLMDGKKADCVFTDPPYNALKSWNKDEAKSECRLDPSKWFRNDNMEWEDYKNFLLISFSGFTGHSVYVCCDFRVYPLITEAIIKNGWDLKHCIVWVKNIWGLGKRYRFQHEFIVYASQKDAPFFGDRSQSDVWNIDVDRNNEHNTPKPIALCTNAINNSSRINNIILDLFGGSGSTLIACEQLNRKCFMMEIYPIYCDVIIKRWETYTNKKAVKLS